VSVAAVQQPRAQFEQFAARPKPPAAAAPAPASPPAASASSAPRGVKPKAGSKPAEVEARAEPVAAK
jgi:NADH:ubiquinone reductase (H+-translocating)